MIYISTWSRNISKEERGRGERGRASGQERVCVCTGTIFHKTQAKKLPLAADGNRFRNPESDIT